MRLPLGERALMGWVELVEDTFVVGRREHIVAAIWRGTPTLERLQRSFGAVVRAIERGGQGRVAFLKIIEPSSPPPEPVCFPWLASELDELRDRVVATAVVFEDRGPPSDALVDTASTIHSLTRPRRQPLKILTDIDEATVWLMRHLDLPPTRATRAEALAWLAALRAEMPQLR